MIFSRKSIILKGREMGISVWKCTFYQLQCKQCVQTIQIQIQVNIIK